MIKSKYNVIAVMSGTSLDGIDLVHATYNFDESWSFKINHSSTIEYSKDWLKILRNLVHFDAEELSQIDIDYSVLLGTEILDFISRNNISNIDFVSSHGHTALHEPENGITYQIGNVQAIANSCNLKIICDFREQDVSMGGQGAPLVPIGDKLLFYEYDYCLNLGGFANISFDSGDLRIAYDICPVNIVLNHYVRSLGLSYDNNGMIASKGLVNMDLLDKLNSIQYYSLSPPKSLGLEWVVSNIYPIIDLFEIRVEDILRTFIEHCAIQISKAVLEINKSVLVTGGGAYNGFLMARIIDLGNATFTIPSPEIIEYKEALVFGLLGILKERNEINCLKSVTGASRDHSSGKVLMPKSKIKD